MTLFLANKRILLGVTGGIAAYKSAELCRRLRDAGAVVRVVMTENAKRFITPLTMQAVSGHPVHDDLFDLHAEAAMGHIELARWADAIVVAPATADFMARMAHGQADDLLTTLCLATQVPIALLPAMNQQMWKHTFTQENFQRLQQHKRIHVFGPADGSQACGEVGPGRMLEPESILEKVSSLFAHDLLAGLKVVVTAGPTREHIDPVRYITNASSGKMGFALAEAAREAGAEVTLITGPVTMAKPTTVKCEQVVTAQEMYDAVMKKMPGCDIFLAVAAVSDYRSAEIAPQKIHKDNEQTSLSLLRTEDIVKSVAQLANKPFIVGFAAETENVIAQAKAKREKKGMNMIIANQLDERFGMGSDDNEVTVITNEQQMTLPAATKRKLARQLIAIIAKEYERG